MISERRPVRVQVIMPPADGGPAVPIIERRWIDADGNQWRTNEQPLNASADRGRPIVISGPDRECFHTDDGEPYCGDPACDIYFCPDCGDEFTEPCARHIDTPYEAG